MKSDEWEYATGIIKFHSGNTPPVDEIEIKVSGAAAAEIFSGSLCQAARQLLRLSQDDLRRLAGVSRKTINDYENGLADPSVSITYCLVLALEGHGAQFIREDDAVGVRVALDRKRHTERSRASRDRASIGDAAGRTKTSPKSLPGSVSGIRRGPGRPRKDR